MTAHSIKFNQKRTRGPAKIQNALTELISLIANQRSSQNPSSSLRGSSGPGAMGGGPGNHLAVKSMNRFHYRRGWVDARTGPFSLRILDTAEITGRDALRGARPEDYYRIL